MKEKLTYFIESIFEEKTEQDSESTTRIGYLSEPKGQSFPLRLGFPLTSLIQYLLSAQVHRFDFLSSFIPYTSHNLALLFINFDLRICQYLDQSQKFK